MSNDEPKPNVFKPFGLDMMAKQMRSYLNRFYRDFRIKAGLGQHEHD